MSIISRNEDILNLQDQINAFDKYQMKNYNNPKKPKFYTEIDAYNELGEQVWKGKHNELILSGGLFTLSKISGVDPTIKPTNLNVDLSIASSAGQSWSDTTGNSTSGDGLGPRRNDVISGFVVGIGGSGDSFDSVNAVEYKERVVSNIIPFRSEKRVLSSSDKGLNSHYGLCKYNGATGRYDYYLKRFESDPVIKAEFSDGSAVPANVDKSTITDTINTYIQYTLKISKDDIRKYFETSGIGLKQCRINSLSLVTGYPVNNIAYVGGTDNGVKYTEFRNVRCFSKINFNNEPFVNTTKELTIVYKIYI